VANSIDLEVVNMEEVTRAFDAAGEVLSGAVLAKMLLAAAEVIRDEANTKAPSKVIAAKITEKRKWTTEAAVGPPREKWYYKYLEFGVGPHVVTAKSAKALRFLGNVYRRRIMHPGFPARPFLRPAVDKKTDEAVAKAAQVAAEELSKKVSG
jgi:HK97 gp10 family phage protein